MSRYIKHHDPQYAGWMAEIQDDGAIFKHWHDGFRAMAHVSPDVINERVSIGLYLYATEAEFNTFKTNPAASQPDRPTSTVVAW